MDHFVLGKRHVNCEIIEADKEGISPDEANFNQNSQSLLDVIRSTSNKVKYGTVLVDLVLTCCPLRFRS